MSLSTCTRAIALSTCCVMGAAACAGIPAQAPPSPAPPVRSTPARAGRAGGLAAARSFMSCTGVVSLVTSAGVHVVVSRSTTRSLKVTVGEVLRIVAPGRCRPAVSAGVLSGVVRSRGGHAPLVAARVGAVVIDLTYPMCAEETHANPACQGGVDSAGRIVVRVTSTSIHTPPPWTQLSGDSRRSGYSQSRKGAGGSAVGEHGDDRRQGGEPPPDLLPRRYRTAGLSTTRGRWVTEQ